MLPSVPVHGGEITYKFDKVQKISPAYHRADFFSSDWYCLFSLELCVTFFHILRKLNVRVEMRGLEPLASALQRRRSPN
jgi:hypothetical protein